MRLAFLLVLVALAAGCSSPAAAPPPTAPGINPCTGPAGALGIPLIDSTGSPQNFLLMLPSGAVLNFIVKGADCVVEEA